MAADASEVDEAAILRRVQAGDNDAFDGLVRLHQARLRSLAARYVADADDVYDLVQDVFVEAFRHIGTIDAERGLGPWIRTVLRNRIANLLRDRGTRRAHHLALIDAVLAEQARRDEPDEPAAVEALRGCLDGLQESHRLLVMQRYHQCQPVKELAAQAGKSETALSMVLLRIRDHLGRCLENRLKESRG